MNSLIDTTEEQSNEELKADLEAAGKTWEQFISALVSVSSYAICNALYVTRRAIDKMNVKLRADKDCNRNGYKMHLNAVVSAMNAHTAEQISHMPTIYERVRIVQVETHEYMTEHLMRMYYTAYNWLSFHKFPRPDLMADVFVAICMCNMTCEIIDDRIEKLEARGHKYRAAERYKPLKVQARLQDLAKKLEDLYPGADECDINECEGLHIGTKAICNVCFDLDLMEMHTAYGIEQTEGARVLQEEAPESYKLLHPNYGNNEQQQQAI